MKIKELLNQFELFLKISDEVMELEVEGDFKSYTTEVDEEFVKKHTKENSVTVDQYKEEVKKRLEEREEFMNNQNLIYQLTDYLFENAKFNPSEEALAWQFSVMLDEYNRQAEQSGSTLSQMLEANGMSIRDAYDEIKSAAPQAVQSSLLIDELMKKFPSTVTEDDVKKWFDTLSTSMGYGNAISYEDYKSYMGLENLKKAVEQENAILKAAKSCNIVDEEEE